MVGSKETSKENKMIIKLTNGDIYKPSQVQLSEDLGIKFLKINTEVFRGGKMIGVVKYINLAHIIELEYE